MKDDHPAKTDAAPPPAAPEPAKRPRPVKLEVINKRAVAVGLLIFALLLGGTVLVRLAGGASTLDKLQDFKFTVDKPDVEDFELEKPMRDILQERPDEMPDELEDERPDIQVSQNPVEILQPQDVIVTNQIEVDTPVIEVDATEVDLDAPEEISEATEEVTFAANVISTKGADADIFKYKRPTPREKPRDYLINRAPRPSRQLKVIAQKYGDQDAPTTGVLGPANINLFGTGDFFRTMSRFGGVQARSAVDAALHWLAMHQEPAGHWDSSKWEGQAHDAAATAFALLAFMGGGHTTRKGEYRRNVLRGVEALMRMQQANSKGAVNTNMYEHCIATIALCEAYGRARDERVGVAARKAVYYIEKGVNPDGGWRYTANCGTSDMSVVAWAVQALKTAKLARIKFDHGVYSRAMAYLDSCTDRGGAADSTGGVSYTYHPNQRYGAGSYNLTPAGMVLRQFSGIGVKSHLLRNAAKTIAKGPPSWKAKNFYRWYYATYAMHNMGGEHRVWWNRRIRDVLLENQSRDGDNAGSWDPKGAAYAAAGRVYTTAVGALCLEVYYRYSEALNSFGVAPDIDDLFLQ